MKKTIIATIIGLFSVSSQAIEYEVINGSKYNNNEIYFTNANTGHKMETFHKDGKIYLAGKVGDNYEINICSNYRKYGRSLYIVSVDGLNVISGEPANYNQSGYVVSNGGCSKIKGWRKNMNEEARFIITSASGSYATRTNNDQKNIGVIGFAVFNEDVPAPIVTPMIMQKNSTAGTTSDSGPSMPTATASEIRDSSTNFMNMRKEEKIGTGHGERVNSEAQKTEFKKSTDKPARVLQFYYDTYENLLSKGIIVIKQEQPNPFPGEVKFAPDPKS